MEQIITSILDTDLYKLTMQQCVFHQYPNATAKYVFKCRNKGIKLGFLAPLINEQIKTMANLSLTQNEEFWAREKLPFLTDDYFTYLRNYRFKPEQVNCYAEKISLNGNSKNVIPDSELIIEIEGPWVETILYEVPILAIVNELYFRETSEFKTIEGRGIQNLKDKMNLIRQYPTLTIAEFGTRRRYSGDWQKYILTELIRNCPQVVGTSNIKLAMDLNIKPIGTMAHEYISAHLALAHMPVAQKRAMHVWLQEYGTNLGIALTDTFTSDAFLRDFDFVLANTFAGVRHDSGDPVEFGRKFIAHYKKLGIDPRTKTIVFSDGLDVPEAIRIYKEFTGLIGVSFGIGTNLTNDLGVTPLNIVIKLIECNGKNVCKLSDNPGKAMGDVKTVEIVKGIYVK